MKKKWILLAIVAVSTCLFGMKAEAASAVNDYIIKNNVKPAGETLSLGKIYNQNPNKNGGIKMDFTGGKPKMVIIHEVGVDGGSINGSIDYMIKTQDLAFVHSFVDSSQLITIADKAKKSWGSGQWGNNYGIQIEQMRVTTSAAFYKQIATLAKWSAVQLIIYDMGAPKLMSSPSSVQKNDLSIKPDGNLASHKMIAYKFNQTTNHVDPDEYWARFGYNMTQFRDLVSYYYNQLGIPKINSTSVEGNPATGEFKVRVKTSGVVTRVSVPIWSHANGQDDLLWYPATKVKDDEYLATFDGANHNYQSGLYAVHAYAYSPSKQVSTVVNGNLQVNYPTTPIVHYQTHVQSIGWQQSVTDGATSGTVGQSLRVEALKLAVTGNVSGGIQYQTHVQGIGWQNGVANNALSGTTGKSLRVEAIRIDLTGDLKSQYDIYYRVQSQNKGWLGWAKNGDSAGTQGFGLRLESLQVKLVKKGTAFDVGSEAFVTSDLAVSYQTHIQGIGWQASVKDGAVSGTVGKSLRLESVKINVDNVALNKMTGGVQYQTHVQGIGWQNPVSDNALSGTTGKSLRVEAIRINLTGTLGQNYDIYYRVNVQDKGWLGWAKNGESAGTQGFGLRLEAMQVKLVKKGTAFDAGGDAFFNSDLVVNYQTHVQNLGWQTTVKEGETSGTSGKGLRLEGIKIDVANLAFHKMTGGIQYQTHIQNIGWQNAVSNNAISGTTGQGLRLEAIRINLTGTLAENYDIYYRVHIQNKGWLGWAKNGASAGSEGQALRLEAIQIILVKQGFAFDAGGTAFVVPPPAPAAPAPISPSPSPAPTPVFNLSGVNDTQKAWFNAIYPEAQKLAKANDLFPSIMMSQTILETGWGQSELATKANNFFGVQADASWKGAKYTALTNEVINGKTVQVMADFRKYNSQAESLKDYVTKIKTTMNGSANRYQGAWRSNAKTYQNAAKALQAGGYATDPDYATKLIERIDKYKLNALD